MLPLKTYLLHFAVLVSMAKPVLAQCHPVKVIASDGRANDYFGDATSISSSHLLVGAKFHDHSGVQSGAAYVFAKTGPEWRQVDELIASDSEPNDWFGHAVAMSGDLAVIGARWGDDACPSDPDCNSGAVYVFRLQEGRWLEEAKLTAGDAFGGDGFGESVAVDGDTVVVGAWYDDDAGEKSGSAYVFRRVGSAWLQEAKLTASDAEPGDQFGRSVSIDGDVVVVGGFLADDACEENSDCNSGAVYVFRRAGSTWVEEDKLIGSDTAEGDIFGVSVAIGGIYVIAGASYDDDACDPSYPWDCASGSAYIFRSEAGNWVEEAKLTASDEAYGGLFGHWVAIDGQYAAVARRHPSAVYIFRRTSDRWVEVAQVRTPEAATIGDVAICGSEVVLGAPGDDHAGSFSGAAFVYSVPACAIPTLSGWGLTTIVVLLATAGTIVLRRRMLLG